MIRTSIVLLLLALCGSTVQVKAQQTPKIIPNINSIERFPNNREDPPLLQQTEPVIINDKGGDESHSTHTCPKGTREVAQQLPVLPGEFRAADGIKKYPNGKIELTYSRGGCSK